MARGDSGGGKMVDLPSIDLENAGSIINAGKTGDFCLWFSDDIAVKYAGKLRARFSNAKNPVEREGIYHETEAVLAIYAICTYYIYPNSKEFMKKINASKEYSKNFTRIKDWLDANDGKRMADGFFTMLTGIETGGKGAN
jgi:hypothetical protein